MQEATELSVSCPVCEAESVARRELYAFRDVGPLGREIHHQAADKGWYYDCQACGAYVVTQTDDSERLRKSDERHKWHPRRIAILLAERATQRLPVPWLQFLDQADAYWRLVEQHQLPGDWVPIKVSELLGNWPMTVQEKLDRTLANLVRLSVTGGERLDIAPQYSQLVFADTQAEEIWLIKSLEEMNLLAESGSHLEGLVKTVTAEGWKRFEDLQSAQSLPQNPVFVAQWFGDESTKALMDDLFQQGIAPAVKKAGYRVIRVDLEQHNDYIMDKVLADIRVAPFVVADFTGNRNGAYFEAGFARGLGRPVIHSCRRHPDFDQAHFDTKQLNHILWDQPSDLSEKLYLRIMNTIGRGPYPTD